MARKDNILNELSELNSNLLISNPVNPLSVPAGYFEGLADQVLARIRAMEATGAGEELEYLSPFLNGLSKQMPYSIPSGYFSGLEENILQIVSSANEDLPASEETAKISPLLSGLNKEMPYRVPQGYFENLSTNQRNETNEKQTKVVSLSRRSWFRYAAAAVVTGLIIGAGFLIFGNKKEMNGDRVLAKVTRDVKKLNETQKDDLIEFLDAGLSGKETVNNGAKTKEVRELLKGIPEKELEDFQQQTEEIADVLMTN